MEMKVSKTIQKQIRAVVTEHYKKLDKKYGWVATGDDGYVCDFCAGDELYLPNGTWIGFDMHRGDMGDATYRWVDSADVLFPKLKKITGAEYVTVGVLGDLSNVGGIHVTCGGIKAKKASKRKLWRGVLP